MRIVYILMNYLLLVKKYTSSVWRKHEEIAKQLHISINAVKYGRK